MNSAPDESRAAQTVRRLRRVMALFTGLLVASTWPLWLPASQLPQIPWLGWTVSLPRGPGEIVLVGNLVVFLLLQFLNTPRKWFRQLQLYFFLTSVPLLLLLDQHRLQPWAWQMLIGAGVIALSHSPRLSLRCLQWFTISIYVWSAISKLDWAFIEGHGQLLVSGLASSLGLSAAVWPEALRQLLAAALPVAEFAVAVLLAIPTARRIGLWSAIAMHVALILTLGPTGLGHEWGVLIWNVYFIIQAWLLFGESSRIALTAEFPERDPQEDPLLSPALALTAIASLAPALSLIGSWDWWPSWAVYSSRPAVVQMLVEQQDIDRLPPTLRPHVGAPQPLSNWCPVSIDAWSYAACWCPIYPQERYRLAVIASISRDSGVRPRVIVRSSPNRWTGQRSESELTAEDLDRRLEEFWINTDPREVPSRPSRD